MENFSKILSPVIIFNRSHTNLLNLEGWAGNFIALYPPPFFNDPLNILGMPQWRVL